MYFPHGSPEFVNLGMKLPSRPDVLGRGRQRVGILKRQIDHKRPPRETAHRILP